LFCCFFFSFLWAKNFFFFLWATNGRGGEWNSLAPGPRKKNLYGRPPSFFGAFGRPPDPPQNFSSGMGCGELFGRECPPFPRGPPHGGPGPCANFFFFPMVLCRPPENPPDGRSRAPPPPRPGPPGPPFFSPYKNVWGAAVSHGFGAWVPVMSAPDRIPPYQFFALLGRAPPAPQKNQWGLFFVKNAQCFGDGP